MHASLITMGAAIWWPVMTPPTRLGSLSTQATTKLYNVLATKLLLYTCSLYQSLLVHSLNMSCPLQSAPNYLLFQVFFHSNLFSLFPHLPSVILFHPMYSPDQDFVLCYLQLFSVSVSVLNPYTQACTMHTSNTFLFLL